MTKKGVFSHIKNSKTSRDCHVKYAVRICVFYAKKLRVIFRPAFLAVWLFYWTFIEEVAECPVFNI